MAQKTGKPACGARELASVKLEFEDQSATAGTVKTEAASAEDLVLRANAVLEMGEPPGGARALGSEELEPEDKPATTGIAKAETVADVDLVLGTS